jgi:hypothetical protein
MAKLTDVSEPAATPGPGMGGVCLYGMIWVKIQYPND